MSELSPQKGEALKRRWDKNAATFDDYSGRFVGAVGDYVDWELLSRYLPGDRSARILDAAGGTGRITLPLARMGYSVTLCDISPAMLDVARRKLQNEGLLDRVEILECDVRDPPFAREMFDFVLCWDGAASGILKLIQAAKMGGRVSISLGNKWATVLDRFFKDPGKAMSLIDSVPACIEEEYGSSWVASPNEARKLFEAEGVKVIDVCATWGWCDLLGIPEEVQDSREWDQEFFTQTTDLIMKLTRELSVQGMARHLIIYGEKVGR